MNKQELLSDLSGKTWVNALIGAPVLQEQKANSDKWYYISVREVVGQACQYRNVHFYVVGENLEGETAYYKDSVPVASIREVTP